MERDFWLYDSKDRLLVMRSTEEKVARLAQTRAGVIFFFPPDSQETRGL